MKQDPNMPGKDDAWLARPSSIRLLWWVFIIVLALSVLVQLIFPVKGYFGIDSGFGFGAWYGFGACALMVVVAKLLGYVLKRPANYYQQEDAEIMDD